MINLLKNIKSKFGAFIYGFQKVDLFTLAVFTRQFALMYRSGINILASVRVLAEQTQNKKLKAALDLIYQHLATGSKTLYGAFKIHPDVFPPVYLAMIAAGEKSGGAAFSLILDRLADGLEKQNRLKSKVSAALSYPIIIVSIAFAVIIASAYIILPKFVPILESFNVEKPFATKILIGFISVLNNFWLAGLLVICIYLLVNLFIFIIKTPFGRHAVEEILLSTPVLNRFIIKVNIVYFCRTLSLLYGSGIPLVDALETTKEVFTLDIYKNYIKNMTTAIKEDGQEMNKYMYNNPLFPAELVQIMKVGEETGDLANVLVKLANLYETELEYVIDTMVHLLEPMIMVLLGGVVFFIISAVFLPLYKMFGEV